MTFLELFLVTSLIQDPSAPLQVLEPTNTDSVMHDVDGSVHWAVGNDYKLRVDSGGATYFPRLGSRAKQNLPIRFRLAGAPEGVVTRIGDRITIDRGGLVERYDLRSDELEQSFEIRDRSLARGLRIEIETELERADVPTGLRFRAQGLADVHYGDVTIRDALGGIKRLPARFDGNAIVLDVPESFARTARFPIVVDPIIKTFNVDNDTNRDCSNPDVAFCRVSNSFLVAFEKVFSGSDRDIIGRRVAVDGALLEQVIVDASEHDSIKPAAASHGNEFLVVWEDHGVLDNASIKARKRIGNGSFQGPIFKVSAAVDVNPRDPDVGSSATFGLERPYIVTYGRGFDSFAVQIYATDGLGDLTRTGSLGGVFGDGGFSRPRITQQVESGGSLVMVCESLKFAGLAKSDIVAFPVSSVGFPGAMTVLTEDIDTLAGFDVAGDGATFLAAWSEDVGAPTRFDVFGRQLQFDGSLNATSAALNLSTIEPNVDETLDQGLSGIAFDGTRFTYVYRESKNGGLGDVFAATLFPGSTATFSAGHVAIGSSTADEREATIAAAKDPGLHLIGWTRRGVVDDVQGALFSSLGAGVNSVLQTGCGAQEPVLLGIPSVPMIGGSFGVIAVPSGQGTSGFLLSGVPAITPICSLGCSFGVLASVTLPVPFQQAIEIVLPSDPALMGTQIGLQAIEAFPPISQQGGTCTTANGQIIRTTDTTVMTLR